MSEIIAFRKFYMHYCFMTPSCFLRKHVHVHIFIFIFVLVYVYMAQTFYVKNLRTHFKLIVYSKLHVRYYSEGMSDNKIRKRSLAFFVEFPNNVNC